MGLKNFYSAPEEILAIEDSRDPKNQKKAGTGNWKYTVKNSMFYGGDKEAEKVYTFKKPFKPREIVHENTRFKKGRFRNINSKILRKIIRNIILT